MPKYTLKASDGASYTLDSPNELTQDQLDTAFSEALQQFQASQPQPAQQPAQPYQNPYANYQNLPAPDLSQNPYAIAEAQGRTPETTAGGLLAAAGRGAAPYAAAATLGAAAGPLGAAAAPTALFAADMITPVVNSILGTNYSSPSESIQNLLTLAGTPNAGTEAERIVQAVSSGAAGASAFTGLGKTLLGSANPLAQRVGQVLMESPLAQYFGGAGAVGAQQAVAEQGGGPIPQVLASLVGGVAGMKASGQMPSIGKAIGEVITPEGAPVTPPQTLKEVYRTSKSKILPFKQEEITQLLKNDPLSADAARYKLYNNKAIVDNQAINVINQGWQDSAVSAIKSASIEDKMAMKKMLNVFKIGEKNAKYRALNRPSDIVGQTVEKQINYLSGLKKDAGEAINRIAKTELFGKKVDVQPAMQTFINELESIGVSLKSNKSGIIKADLKNSQIQGDKESERILNAVLERLSDVNAPDAFGVHTAKQFIDTQVSYGKNVANPLTQKSEIIIKNLRRNLNQTLNQSFENYQKMNTQYSETKKALDALQKAVGVQIDFNSPNASKALGTSTRKMLSNYNNRVNMIDALDSVNQTAKSYGLKSKNDVVNQLLFANELDRMFGTTADTSLKGQVGQAMNIGLDIARGNIAQRAVDLATAGINKLQGVNKENAIKTMGSFLEQETLKAKK